MNERGFPDSNDLFPPRRADGLDRLADFVPRSGRKYAAERNADPGPGRKANVSQLSPYIRHRLITEREVAAAVLERYAPSTAEKFIQEVLWRTYWKGWLQMRPQVWQAFLDERDRERERVHANSGLSTAWSEAEAGRTGIECFDDWAQELAATGYLHNHARMWFASIWIFTLKLPWALGADFFLRHLIDGDPASNTLGWRWVAGIQTRGKTYLARPGNIAKYTDGRYDAQTLGRQLASEAPPIRDETPPKPAGVAELDPVATGEPAILLLHGDDLAGFELLRDGPEIASIVVSGGGDADAPWPFGDKAGVFVEAAVVDAGERAADALGCEFEIVDRIDQQQLIEAAGRVGVSRVVTPDAPVGPIDDALVRVKPGLEAAGLELGRIRRDWDDAAWPYATKGFFPFKKKIPELLERAGLVGD